MNYGLWIWLLYSVVCHLRINLSIFKRFMNWPWTSSLQWSKRDNSNSSLHNEKSAAYSFTCFKNLIAALTADIRFIFSHTPDILKCIFFFKLGFCQLTLQLKCKQKTNTEHQSNSIYTVFKINTTWKALKFTLSVQNISISLLYSTF